ncbi:MAG TPA: hypothetical protein VE173_02730 [Longimicrobiales bacterium]|jgi:hypothetical protein|nr:hypothetical protein [Longimicrobiales bacterium]
MVLWLHSALRYVAFLAALAVFGYGAWGLAARRPFDETMRKLGAAFGAALLAEVLVGVGLLFTGSFSPAATGHILMMLFATGVAQVVPSVMKRRPPAERSHLPYLVATAVAAGLMVLGIMALGRPVLG